MRNIPHRYGFLDEISVGMKLRNKEKFRNDILAYTRPFRACIYIYIYIYIYEAVRIQICLKSKHAVHIVTTMV
jgi:hypothetical protein